MNTHFEIIKNWHADNRAAGLMRLDYRAHAVNDLDPSIRYAAPFPTAIYKWGEGTFRAFLFTGRLFQSGRRWSKVYSVGPQIGMMLRGQQRERLYGITPDGRRVKIEG
jgi:hypothetical protein